MASRVTSLRLTALCALLVLPLAVAHGDELKLADGSTIKGAIVGFDDNSFKVQTSYGFALVRKDQVVTISVIGSSNASAPEKKPEPAITTAPKTAAVPSAGTANIPVKPATPVPPTVVISNPSEIAATAALPSAKLGPPPPLLGATHTTSSAPITTNASPAKLPVAKGQPRPAPVPTAAQNVPVASAAGAPPATRASAAPPPAAPDVPAPVVAAAPKHPAPEPIRETVSGNTYMNNTYRFEMYKPPGWQVLAAARTVLPGAIAALGTDDQETYLLIGQEPAGKPLYLEADAADKRLRDVMENFRPQGQEQMLVAGSWSPARRFRGSVDEHEWSGVVVLVPHGTRLYTIFGMTRADTDLVQIQENVIARAIASLQFIEP